MRKPSWPCEFASSEMGCANVRPSEVSARRWSVPAEMCTKLFGMWVYELETRGGGGREGCVPFASFELLSGDDFGKVDVLSLAP